MLKDMLRFATEVAVEKLQKGPAHPDQVGVQSASEIRWNVDFLPG